MNRVPVNPLVARALEIAEKHLGLAGLCARLGAPEALVRAWRFGHAEMPNERFLSLVDLLTTPDPQWSKGAVASPKGRP